MHRRSSELNQNMVKLIFRGLGFISIYLILAVGTVFASVYAWSLISGQLELTRWHDAIVSNKNVLFFFNLMAIGAGAGFAGSKMKGRFRKILVWCMGGLLIFMIWILYIWMAGAPQ